MDAKRFDEMTKTLAEGTSRRRVVKGMFGGAVGAVAGVVGLRRAGAVVGTRSSGQTCSAHVQCRTGFCHVYANGHGRCRCPEGRSVCRDQLGNETCRDLRCDIANCGACGNVCAGVACVGGVCSSCLECFMNVGGICVPDPNAPDNGPCTCGFEVVGGICVPKVCVP